MTAPLRVVPTAPESDPLDAYAESAARGMLASLVHYGYHNPPCGDGRMATPAWFANRLGKVLNARGDSLPGDPLEWWGTRWEKYANQILAD